MDYAVIGHGRSPEGRGWGPKIDACGVVVRMWNWHWQKPEDYGTRYDYGLLEVAPSETERFEQNNKHTPTLGWLLLTLRDAEQCTPPTPNEKIVATEWVKLARSMGGRGEEKHGGRLEFCRGTQAGCWAIEHAAPGDRVILVGHDYVSLGRSQVVSEAISPEYMNSGGFWPYTENFYRPNVRRFGWTDYGIEYPTMHRLATNLGVELVLAQAIWP